MSFPLLDHQDYGGREAQNMVIQRLASAPGTPTAGQVYYDTTLNQFGCYQNATWVYLAPAGGGGDVSQTANSGGGSRLKVSAGANKTIQDFASAGGIVKVATDGTVSLAVADTDYATPAGILAKLLTGYTAGTSAVIAATDSILEAFRKVQAQITGYSASTKTLTNTTLDANGTGNAISNLETADFAAGVIQTTVNGSSTNTQLPTALAVFNAIQSGFATNDALVYKGAIDASTNPNYPAADAGWTYKISVAGKIGGASGVNVKPGDTLYCNVDATATGNHATIGANWTIVQANADTATDTVEGLVELATLAETEAKTDTIRAVTPADLLNFTLKKIFTVGDGVATSIACTHNLATSDVTVTVRRTSDNAVVQCGVVITSTNVITLSFSTAPATGTIKVVVVG